MTSSAIAGSVAGSVETSRWAYDDNDNVRATTTPMGHPTTLGYDAVDRLVSRTDATNRVTGYGYDAAGNREMMVTPRGMALLPAQRGPYATTWTFNGADEVVSARDGLGNVTSYTYDADGNQESVTAPGSQSSPGGSVIARRTTRTFDGRNLPWTVTTDDGLGLPATSVRATVTEYDANADDHLFRTDFTYTNAGFVQTTSLPYDVTAGKPAISTTYVHFDNGWIRSPDRGGRPIPSKGV